MLLLLLSRFSMSDSVQPHRQQPTRLPCLRDSPGKNTGVGCHFLLQRIKVKNESEAAQSWPTLSDPIDCSLPGSPHGIFQARVLEWGAIAFSEKQYIEKIYSPLAKTSKGGTLRPPSNVYVRNFLCPFFTVIKLCYCYFYFTVIKALE